MNGGEKKRWGFIGISAGAGVSFLTAVTAGFLAEIGERPAVLELGHAGMYHSLGLEQRFAFRGYESPYSAVREDRSMRNIVNLYRGINWAVLTEEDARMQRSFREAMRLIYDIEGSILLCDFSGRAAMGVETEDWEDTWHLLREMERVFVVIDPLPSKLLAGAAMLARFRLSQLPVTYVVNKDNKAVNRRELNRFLHLQGCVFIPHAGVEASYQAEYRCRDPYSIPEVREKLSDALIRLTRSRR